MQLAQRPRNFIRLLAAILGLILASPLLAQPAGEGVGAELEKTPGEPIRSGEDLSLFRPIAVEFKLSSEHAFSTGVDDSAAELAVTRLGGQLGLSGPLLTRWRWNLEAAVESSWYDFSDASDLIPASDDPVDEVLQITLTPSLLYQHSDSWSFLGGAIIQFAGEFDADVSDSATFGAFLGSRYQLSPSFALQFGVIIKTRIEDNLGVLPLLGFDWRINDKTRLGTEGAGLKLAHELSPQLTVFLKGAWAVREYRLDDDAHLPDGVFRDQRATLALGCTWKAANHLSLEFLAGVVAWNEIRFDDSQGVEVAEENTDPAGFLGVTGVLRF